jgi:hypothetical protein
MKVIHIDESPKIIDLTQEEELTLRTTAGAIVDSYKKQHPLILWCNEISGGKYESFRFQYTGHMSSSAQKILIEHEHTTCLLLHEAMSCVYKMRRNEVPFFHLWKIPCRLDLEEAKAKLDRIPFCFGLLLHSVSNYISQKIVEEEQQQCRADQAYIYSLLGLPTKSNNSLTRRDMRCIEEDFYDLLTINLLCPSNLNDQHSPHQSLF